MSKSKRSYSQKETYISFNPNDTGHTLGIDFTQNPEQRELIRLMNQNDLPIIFCFGDAGTGKTFTALAAAINLVRVRRKYSKIFYIREPLEVGKSLGFLPGDLSEKYSVYLAGLEDNLDHIATLSALNKNDMKSCIECQPPQYIRGRSFSDEILIVDEAQNLSLDTIHAIVTRLGKYCKLVFLGSYKQIDAKGMTEDKNDYKTAFELMSELDFVGNVTLLKSERSEYCATLDKIFSDYKAKK